LTFGNGQPQKIFTFLRSCLHGGHLDPPSRLLSMA
jgi:hypothetical protein